MTFDEWWKQTKPAECDELKPYFVEAWEIAATTEREACAKIADAKDDMMEYGAGEEIRMRSNVELTGATDRARPVDRRVGRQPDEDSQKRGPFDDIFAGCRLTQEQFDEHERVCEERARKEREDASNAPR